MQQREARPIIESEEEEGIAELIMPHLKGICRAHGLHASGRKDDLALRVATHLEALSLTLFDDDDKTIVSMKLMIDGFEISVLENDSIFSADHVCIALSHFKHRLLSVINVMIMHLFRPNCTLFRVLIIYLRQCLLCP